jgi:hypothetical protein
MFSSDIVVMDRQQQVDAGGNTEVQLVVLLGEYNGQFPHSLPPNLMLVHERLQVASLENIITIKRESFYRASQATDTRRQRTPSSSPC